MASKIIVPGENTAAVVGLNSKFKVQSSRFKEGADLVLLPVVIGSWNLEIRNLGMTSADLVPLPVGIGSWNLGIRNLGMTSADLVLLPVGIGSWNLGIRNLGMTNAELVSLPE